MSEVERFDVLEVAAKLNCCLKVVRATDYDTLKVNLDLAVGALKALKLRIHYINHPAEAMWTPHDVPVPDWRNEIAILEAALKQLGIDTGEGRW
jgi:hypothetical protein